MIYSTSWACVPRHWTAAVSSTHYCPYDIHGNPVILREERDREGNAIRLRHVFKGDEGWMDPVQDNVRTDDPREMARRERMRQQSEREMPRTTSQEESMSGRRSASGISGRERRRESGSMRDRERESGSAPGSAHGRKEGGGGFTAVNRG